MSKNSYSLSDISARLEADLQGDPNCVISSIAPLDKAKTGQISFLHSPRYKKFLNSTGASAVVLSPENAQDCQINRLVMKNPYLGFAKLAELFEVKPSIQPGIHPTAVIGKNTTISPTASIGPHCVVGDHVSIGNHTVLNPGCVIGDGVTIANSCVLWANVTLYRGISLANRVIIHSGAVIGSDGFGLANDRGKWHKIPQLGGVLIGDDVEIGANTTIDRGALEDTVIEEGVKLDNQIQIGHNVHIGAHTVVAGCVAIAGSVHIGKYCMIGGAAAISGHLELVDQVILTAGATVSSSITEPGIYSSGMPARPNQEWRKNAVRFLHLDNIARRLSKLEKQLQLSQNEADQS